MLCDSFDVGGPQLEKLMSLLNTNKDLAFFEMKLLLFLWAWWLCCQLTVNFFSNINLNVVFSATESKGLVEQIF